MFQKKSSPKFSRNFRKFICGFVFLFSISFTPPAADSQNTEPSNFRLEPGNPVEREISGGQKHEYQIAFSANQYAKISVGQRGIDVVVRLIDENGKILIETNTEPRLNGVEIIELFSDTAKNLRLTIEPRQKSARPGQYQIRIVEQHNATSKEIALDRGRKLFSESNMLWRAGKYAEALPLAEQVLTIRQRELNTEHFEIGQSFFLLANIYGDLGDYVKCENFYIRALDIWEKALGKDHPLIGSILLNWGVVYGIKGDYMKAETLYNRALQIWDKTLDPNHLSIANVLNNLAGISRVKGDTEKAAAYYQRVLTIRENALGPESAEVAQTLSNIANLSDDFAVAEPLYLRSLAIREKVLGPEHQDVAETLYNLARLYNVADNFQKAKMMCERSLEIYEKTLGTEHAFYSYPLNLLAVIYKNTGDYDKSESLYLRAAALKEKSQGLFHPDLGETYAALANLYLIKGEIDKAIAAQTRANEILEYNTALNLTVGSEREKLDYLKTLTETENQTLTLSFKNTGNLAAMNLAVTSILQRKGRVLDTMADSFGVLRRRFDTQDQILLDNLNEATKRLVEFIAEGNQNSSPEDYRKKLKSLETDRETVENQISRRSAGFYESSKPVTLSRIQTEISDKTALIEFAVYRPTISRTFESDDKNTSKSDENLRYAVFVINSKGEAHGKDLGSAKEIESSITDFRAALRDPKRNDVQQLARTLDSRIMEPIRAMLGDAEHLLVAPDGELNLIPFEALADEQNHYLIEKYSFTYLSSGRDLLRMQTARTSKSKSLLIADPQFGESVSDTTIAVNRTRKNSKKRSVTATRSLTDTYFAPLNGTLSEARSIQNLFPEATVLTGMQATETTLKQANAPEILHIATHGFFLEDESFNDQTATRGAKNTSVESENPLLRSGLALAGANRHSTSGDDGILTALEASGLNLWGTKLVVLSACDTGLGDVKNGEGVYGLRRAFVLAGTESLVMSLWSVSDFSTRELMTNYYKNLKSGMGRGASLRKVQLEMMKKKGREHPFYWAAFIESGEWANLDGKR